MHGGGLEPPRPIKVTRPSTWRVCHSATRAGREFKTRTIAILEGGRKSANFSGGPRRAGKTSQYPQNAGAMVVHPTDAGVAVANLPGSEVGKFYFLREKTELSCEIPRSKEGGLPKISEEPWHPWVGLAIGGILHQNPGIGGIRGRSGRRKLRMTDVSPRKWVKSVSDFVIRASIRHWGFRHSSFLRPHHDQFILGNGGLRRIENE